MPVIPKNYADLLETKALAHVATIGPKGEPQNTPVWFGWDGNHVLLTMTKTAQKYLQDVYPWHHPGDEHVVVIVEPQRTTSMG